VCHEPAEVVEQPCDLATERVQAHFLRDSAGELRRQEQVDVQAVVLSRMRGRLEQESGSLHIHQPDRPSRIDQAAAPQQATRLQNPVGFLG
jgi:hypothetical protein